MKWLIWVLKICSEFQVLTLHFLRFTTCSMSIVQKNQPPIYVQCDDRLASRILVFLPWLRYSPLVIKKRKSSKEKPGSSLLFSHNFRTQKKIAAQYPIMYLYADTFPEIPSISTFCFFLGWYWIRAPDSNFQKWNYYSMHSIREKNHLTSKDWLQRSWEIQAHEKSAIMPEYQSLV